MNKLATAAALLVLLPAMGIAGAAAAGGMGGGSGGMGGGGHFGGGMFGPSTNFDQPAAASSDNASNAADNYTYQCVTPAGRCSFVAPAALRANALRSGAACGCGGGQPQGRIE